MLTRILKSPDLVWVASLVKERKEGKQQKNNESVSAAVPLLSAQIIMWWAESETEWKQIKRSWNNFTLSWKASEVSADTVSKQAINMGVWWRPAEQRQKHCLPRFIRTHGWMENERHEGLSPKQLCYLLLFVSVDDSTLWFHTSLWLEMNKWFRFFVQAGSEAGERSSAGINQHICPKAKWFISFPSHIQAFLFFIW